MLRIRGSFRENFVGYDEVFRSDIKIGGRETDSERPGPRQRLSRGAHHSVNSSGFENAFRQEQFPIVGVGTNLDKFRDALRLRQTLHERDIAIGTMSEAHPVL